MATRSLICKELPNGRFRTIFCRFDGYIAHNGCILYDIYDTEEKVDKLLALGDLVSLDAFIDEDEPKQNDDYQHKHGVCIAYGRDHQLDECEAKDLTFKELMKLAEYSWAEYIYMFKKDGTWVYTEDCFGIKGRYSRKEIYDMFEDLKEAVECQVPVSERYCMSHEKATMLDQLEENINAELEALQKLLETTTKQDDRYLNDKLKTFEELNLYLLFNSDSFNEKELKALTSTKKILEALSKIKLDQIEIVDGNQYPNAVQKFCEKYAKQSEQC